jgi:hypothetical protein
MPALPFPSGRDFLPRFSANRFARYLYGALQQNNDALTAEARPSPAKNA